MSPMALFFRESTNRPVRGYALASLRIGVEGTHGGNIVAGGRGSDRRTSVNYL